MSQFLYFRHSENKQRLETLYPVHFYPASKNDLLSMKSGIYTGYSRYYYLKDHTSTTLSTSLGSIRVTLNENGGVAGDACPERSRRDDFSPFGLQMPGRSNNSANRDDDQKACPDHSGFTGHFFEQEGDLEIYHAQARMYDPAIGRFLGVDAMRSKYPSLSTYVYVENNPVIYVDPDGNSGIHFQVAAQSTTFVMRGQISGGFAVDHKGNLAVTATVGRGPAVGVGSTVSASATFYPAPSFTVDQLQGTSNSIGAYITAPGMGGRASIQGVDISSDFDLSTFGGTVGYESGAGLGVFWSIDRTGVYELGNIADGFETIMERLNEITDTLSPEHRDLINQAIQLFEENDNTSMEKLNE